MKLTPIISVLLASLAYADDTGVPITRIAIAAPQNYVVVARSLVLSATPYNAVDAALTGRKLQWQVSNSNLATIDDSGTLRGIAPGVVMVTAADPDSGTQSRMPVYVYPGRIAVSLSSNSMEVGDTATASSRILDADGNPIGAAAVGYSVADPAVASVNGTTITATGEGRTQVLAGIDMGPGFDAYTASAVLEVVRRADYKVTRLIATDTPSTNVKLLVPFRAAAAGSWVASISSLSNGGQGLVLQRTGQNPKIIDSAGAVIDGTDKVIDSFSNLAVNANGDVAALLFTPAEWCEEMILVYRASANWKPSIVFDTTNCNLDIQPRALDSKGGLVYRRGSDYIHWSLDGTETRLFGSGDTVAGLKPLNTLNGWAYTPFGNLVFLWIDTSNVTTAVAWDGASKYTKIIGVTGVVSDHSVSDVQLPVEINPGEFMCRVGSTNWSAIARFKGTAPGTVAAASGVNGVGWIESFYDGIGEDIFFHGDINGGITLFHLNGTNLTPLSTFTIWRETGPVWAAAADAVINYASTGPGPLVIHQIKGTASTTLMGPGVSADGTAYLGLPQYAFVQGASSSSPLFRTSGGFIMKWTGTTFVPVLKPGDTLPGGRTLAYLGTFAANRKGDFAFTAQTQYSRAGLWTYRNGALQLLSESDATLGNQTFQYIFCCERGSSYVAMNGKGQVAATFGTSISTYIYFFDTGTAAPKIVAQMNAAAPGGGNYNCCPAVKLDESGHIGFSSYIDNSRGTFFLWDGTSVRRIIGNGDTDPLGRTLSNINDSAAGNNGFYLNIYPPGYGNTIYSVDASGKVDVAVIPNARTVAGVQVNNLFGPTFALNSSNDLFFPAYTPGGSAILVHRGDGTDKIASIASRRTSGGDWLLTSFPGAATDTGDTFFEAYFWSDGKIRFGLFQASPR